jgi:DNA-binding MarR family transcriptional regulator
MTSDDRHVMHALGGLMTQSRERVLAEGEPGLRPSHYRVLGHVPPEGVTVTELADRVGMTKQGIGQFVTQLVESGHVTVDQKPEDRRIRVVRLTSKGDGTVQGFTELMRGLEATWAERVGKARYREFKKVLEEIAVS